MYITIAGQLGSGKSTVCKILEKACGYTVFSTGAIHRELAAGKALSTLELNKLLADDRSVDDYIDGKLVEYAEAHRGENIIFDSRMAWHFVKESFKLYLIINPRTAAERVYLTRKNSVESYASADAAMKDLVSRKALEDARFADIYRADCGNFANYDLIADTTEASPNEIVRVITDALRAYGARAAYPKLFVSPKNIVPTLTAAEYAAESPAAPLTLQKRGDALYIITGHKVAKKALNGNLPLIPAALV